MRAIIDGYVTDNAGYVKRTYLGETGNYEFLFDMNHINGAEVPQHDERQPEKE